MLKVLTFHVVYANINLLASPRSMISILRGASPNFPPVGADRGFHLTKTGVIAILVIYQSILGGAGTLAACTTERI